MRSRNVWPGSDVTWTLIQSEMTRVPPVTAERSPPDSRMTGADSPVIAEESPESVARSLLECLDEQRRIVQSLIRLAEEKRDVILKRQTARLVELLHDETDAVQELACREEERIRLGACLGVPEGAPIDDWLPRLPREYRDEVRQQADRLVPTDRLDLAADLARQPTDRDQGLACAAIVRGVSSRRRHGVEILRPR